MARRRRKTTARRKPRRQKRSFAEQHLANLIAALVTLLLLVGLFHLGALGTLVTAIFSILVGQTAPVLMVICLFLAVAMMLTSHFPRIKGRFIAGVLVAYCGLLLFVHGQMFDELGRHNDFIRISWDNLNRALFNGDSTVSTGGGMLGAYLYTASNYLVARTGTKVLAWLLMIAGIAIFFALPVDKLAVGLRQFVSWVRQKGGQMRNDRQHRQSQLHQDRKTAAKRQLPQPSSISQQPSTTAVTANVPTEEAEVHPEPQIKVAQPTISQAQEQATVSPDAAAAHDDKDEDLPMADAEEQADDDYQLPPLSLLTKTPPTDQSSDLKLIKANTKKLQDTLKSFGVDATVENVNLGPSVTKYELRPAVGVKVSRITHLADDLALALAARDIRIEAPIPGKSLIGIEVPNKNVATVGFRNMLKSAPHDDRPLDVPLGRTVAGNVMTADLTKMPHLLIAGATGSGKSVAINVILTSILMKAKPHQVKLLLIDPKKVELSVYNDIPHLLTPVVSDPKKAARALGKVVSEMERRYELFSNFGVRNIKGYNGLVKQQNAKDPQKPQPYLPLILVVVDELSDLMMTVSHDVEDAIVRIAQMGRAAGIHMILATQRPSVDVITGLIKANVPSRMAFAVSSGVDSRTILDSNGAEKLLGRGDMLFQPIDKNKPVRIQGAFISDHDVEAVVDFIKKERPAEYDQKMVVSDAEMKQEENDDETDELFDEAVKFVTEAQRASTSLLQRRFRIGYNRAARIVDEMENRGIVGPANGSKPREVYKKPVADSTTQPQ
ncbi:DNA translocase FtsK [uncultured Limosilactobacillus sp.]|uniref:DNA translocase FtsK n=1 Tax=uncultured Limosilactobacillus sp. TaxID=2837629 RepID=UPI0025DD7ABC|nr:DNA translocase FtsK [uncultured Limosilactobacillus sp.]